MPSVQTLATAEEFISPIPKTDVCQTPNEIFGEAGALFNQIHNQTVRLTVKNPIFSFQSFARTQNGQPFFWQPTEQTYKVTTASQFGLWVLSPELTGILTTATTLLRIIESYEENRLSLSCAENLLERYENLIADGREIANATGYGEAFNEILD